MRRHLLLVLVMAAIAGTAAAAFVRASSADAATVACPQGVLSTQSQSAPIAEVLRQAQRLLAKQTRNSQGTIYRLTPLNAPIDIVENLGLGYAGERGDYLPGASAIYKDAKARCGPRTAEASWAIHWWMPMLPVVTPGGYQLIVKTKHGWKIWGAWDCVGSWGKAWKQYWC